MMEGAGRFSVSALHTVTCSFVCTDSNKMAAPIVRLNSRLIELRLFRDTSSQALPGSSLYAGVVTNWSLQPM